MMQDILTLSARQYDKNFSQREALNQVRHIVRKTATELKMDENKVLQLIARDEPIKLFELDIFPL